MVRITEFCTCPLWVLSLKIVRSSSPICQNSYLGKYTLLRSRVLRLALIHFSNPWEESRPYTKTPIWKVYTFSRKNRFNRVAEFHVCPLVKILNSWRKDRPYTKTLCWENNIFRKIFNVFRDVAIRKLYSEFKIVGFE